MRIESLTISNFRCFGPDPVVVEFGASVTAFVGNNGSGKTAVLAALGRLFGVTASQRAITKADFHVARDANRLADDARLSIDCVLGLGDANDVDAAIPDVFAHMSVLGPGESPKARVRLQARWGDDLTPGGTVEEDLRWVTALDDSYEWEACKRVAPAERGFVQFVYVPANRNASDQVTALLKGRLWRAARWSVTLTQAASEAGERLQGMFDADPPSRFIAERLGRRWDEVHQGDTAARPVLKLLESHLDDLVRRAEFVLLPDEAGHPRRLNELSDGQRSLFHIALTAATLEMERDALVEVTADSPFDPERLRRTYATILAIEEPENSLSPFFLSRVMTQARDVGAMAGAQVVVSSHSPSILGRVEPEEVRYARLDPATGTASVRSLALPRSGSEASRFVRLAVRAYPELYFARFVVLAEGESEAIVLPRVARAMGVELDRSFVPIVPLGGRFVRHFWRLLSALDIPYATLLDLDLGRMHGGAVAVAGIVEELGRVGRGIDETWEAFDGDIDPAAVDDVDEARLVKDGPEDAWLRALASLGVFFSWPIDIDFAMLVAFPDAYMRIDKDRRGPRRGRDAVEAKRRVTLKTGGKPNLYEEANEFDRAFAWYPYLFLGGSKPETHLRALATIRDAELAAAAPRALIDLVNCIRGGLP